jgi:hypothetical protein
MHACATRQAIFQPILCILAGLPTWIELRRGPVRQAIRDRRRESCSTRAARGGEAEWMADEMPRRPTRRASSFRPRPPLHAPQQQQSINPLITCAPQESLYLDRPILPAPWAVHRQYKTRSCAAPCFASPDSAPTTSSLFPLTPSDDSNPPPWPLPTPPTGLRASASS